ncbi:Hypothetical_protein [Hexamita inflata]|uniref:Hypothetical_protein n=1 Tax=Hexamita inflata TaxID=28002 RepID=A0AA86NAE3_9EUKA|nr:Hypothetical protein HINF_LOCUS3433 [Hexamita inflata]CAI9915789.1 Hypothetical protein HINF_LOCUS3434 [Hexamita inflata]
MIKEEESSEQQIEIKIIADLIRTESEKGQNWEEFGNENDFEGIIEFLMEWKRMRVFYQNVEKQNQNTNQTINHQLFFIYKGSGPIIRELILHYLTQNGVAFLLIRGRSTHLQGGSIMQNSVDSSCTFK